MKHLILYTILFTAIICLPVSATIIDIPDDYETIQQGIDASTDGDTVLVQPGTYVENINFNGHNIVLGSLFLMTGDTTYIADTIIDGDSSGSVVTFESGEDSTAVICGFTIQHGYATNGGGIFCFQSGPEIKNNTISSNTADSSEFWGQGGGIYCADSSPYILHNIFYGNYAKLSGGGIYCRDSNVLINDNMISNNICLYSGGGGIYIRDSFNTISNNVIVRNRGRAGGIHCLNSNLLITGNIIQNNEVWGEWPLAGGLSCRLSEVTITNNQLSENQFVGLKIDSCNAIIAENLFSENRYGGIVCWGDVSIEIVNNTFTQNMGYFGCGINCSGSSALIAGNSFIGNIGGNAIPSTGGAIYCSGASPLIYRNYFIGNSVDYGGAIYCRELSSPVLVNNIFTENRADSAGGVIFCEGGDSVTFINNSFMNNYSPSGIMADANWRSHLKIVNSIIKEDSLSEQTMLFYLDSLSTVDITYSNIQGGWEGEGNIDIDPLFRDPDNGDFHLMSTECGDPYDSPCIDTGGPDIIDSLLDCSRGLGTILSDMGAYGGGDSVTVGIDYPDIRLPEGFSLSQNYPNPFNAMTVIRYSLPEPSDVAIEIYDILGRKVETLMQGEQQAGYHRVVWNALDKSSGIFFFRIQAGDHSETRRMLLLR